ncbi:hypothetical protein F7725_022982, partial [Dissostichus mawsoni]
MDVLAELDLQLLHFIVMEILLDQVALPLHSSPHVRGNIRNHPGNKELDQERNVLWSRKQNMPELHSIDGGVEPGRVLPVIRPVYVWDDRDIKGRQAVAYVAFHIQPPLRLVGVHVHEPRDHVRGEGYDERLESRERNRNGHPVEDLLPGSDAMSLCCHRTSELSGELPGIHSHLDDVVDECQQGCQGKEATNSVMKPNWITGTQRGEKIILVEEAELSEALQVVVLLPAAVQTLWVVSSVEYSRDQSFLDVSPHLFTRHNDHQLRGQLNQTATRVTLNCAAKHIGIISRIADKFALKESHVEAGGIVVDKLEEEHLHRQFVLILQMGLGNFCHNHNGYIKTQIRNTLVHSHALSLTHVSDPNSHSLIHEVEDHDDDKVDAGGCDRGGQLWRDVGADHLQVGGGIVLHDAGESC